MLEHLLDFEPPVEAHPGATPLEKLTPTEHVNAQISTADWLKTMGAKEDSQVTAEAEQRQARDAFVALTTNVDPTAQHEALATLQTPPAVRHLTGMLSAYDWEFIEHAKSLPGVWWAAREEIAEWYLANHESHIPGQLEGGAK